MESSWEEGCSSSSIPIPPQWEYDVFMSFRGADTCKNFTSHLFAALEDNGFCTFRDDKELKRGEFISDELLKAIEGSKISLIVFSKDYAGSSWCLDELVKIMHCRETLKQIIMPIFYDVDPSDVRKQTGVLQDAFAELEKRFKTNGGSSIKGSGGKVEKWRRALTEAANLSGRHLLNEANRDEAELIRMIINDVRKNVTPLHVPNRQVGLDRRVANLNVLLNMESNCVRIVALWGMGGIGKTTIATRLYDLIQHKFERSGFLGNVRETSLQPNGEELQKKLLKAILNRTLEVSNPYEGIEVIKKTAFGRKKVLLVLDDVDNVQQLKALAIDRDSFAPGSRITITTRDKSSLNDLELGDYEIYGLEKLDEDDSLELFSLHAFKVKHPPEDHLDLSRQIGHYAGGLPLALVVLGSYFRTLRGKSKPEWKSEIEILEKIPNDDVQRKLKISYDSLSDQVKSLFLDMACFFVRMDQDFRVKILEDCNIFAKCGIRTLVDRCLIEIVCHETHDQIVMHDMIRDMGIQIVNQQSLKEPGKRSRLWHPKDVLKVLEDGTGTEDVEGLVLDAAYVQGKANPLKMKGKLWYRAHVLEVRRDGMGTEVVKGRLRNFYNPKDVQVHAKASFQVHAKAFEKMKNLWLLHLDYVHLPASYEHISKRLLWLSWKGFPLDCLRRNFSMEELVALDLRYSSLKKVWNGNMILDKLKFLYLSHCRYLTKTPNFSRLQSLEELLLNDCQSLVEVDESIGCLNKLLVLDMKNCRKLRKLPREIWMLKSLERLDLSGCSELGNAAGFKGPLHKLWCLFSSSRTLPPNSVDSIGLSLIPVQTSSCLTELYLKGCNLSYLSEEIGNLISLRTLVLSKNNLSTLPDSIFNLTRLEALHLNDNNLSHLSNGIGRLTSLWKLELARNNLCALPDTIGKLSSLNKLFVGNNKLSHLPSGIAGLASLCNINIGGNNICTIPDSISNLPRWCVICLDNCAKLRSLPKLPTWSIVCAWACPSLESLPLELDQLGSSGYYTQSNKLAENNFLTRILKQLPKSKGLSQVKYFVSIVVPIGDEEVSILFPYSGRGPNVSFVVPPSPSVKHKMLGWILRFLPGGTARGGFHYVRISEVTCNKIRRKINIENNGSTVVDVDWVWLLYMPQGWNGWQLEGGDEVEISIYTYNVTVIKNWAIDLIYEADEIHEGTDTLYQVVTI